MPSQEFFSPLYEMVERRDLRTARFSEHRLSLSLSVLISELPLFFTLTQPFKVGIHQGYRVRCHIEEDANDRPRWLSHRGLDRHSNSSRNNVYDIRERDIRERVYGAVGRLTEVDPAQRTKSLCLSEWLSLCGGNVC